MFLWNWFVDIFSYFRGKKAKMLFVGLDNAGKSTLLYLMKYGKSTQTLPTGQPTSEELIIQNVTFTTFDVGGHIQARKVWLEYTPIVDAIVFIIDVSDTARLAEAKDELDNILNDEQIGQIPVLILANKIDKQNVKNELEIRDLFGLHESQKDRYNRPIELFMCSFWYNQGYGEAFRWLANKV